jgi:hypothetical protein
VLEFKLSLWIEHRSGVSFDDQASGCVEAREIKIRWVPIPRGKKKKSNVSDSNAHYENEIVG